MKKIIKHGNTVKKLTCPKCGCIFIAMKEDIHQYSSPEKHFEYILCPECFHSFNVDC